MFYWFTLQISTNSFKLFLSDQVSKGATTMLKKMFVILLLLCTIFASATAQEEPVDIVQNAVPLFLSNRPIVSISPNNQYFLAGNDGKSFFVYNLLGEELANLGVTRTWRSSFIERNFLIHQPDSSSSSQRIYELPSMAELERLPLDMDAYWVTPAQDYYFFGKDSVSYQSADRSEKPIIVATKLGYANFYNNGYNYYGGAILSPDRTKLYVAGVNGIVEWDIPTRTETRQFAYPSSTAMAITPDGKYFSATTNSGANWRVIDLATGEEVFSVQSQGRSIGVISPDSRYAVASRGVTPDGRGILIVIDLETGEELLNEENIFTGEVRDQYGGIDPTRIGYVWVENRLMYLRSPQETSGMVTFFNPETKEVNETDLRILATGLPPFSMRYLAPVAGGRYVRVGLNVNTLAYLNASGEIVRTLPTHERLSFPLWTDNGFAMGYVVYGIPTETTPALPTLTGTTKSPNSNVRSYPSSNATRVNGATGEVRAIARNNDGSWVFLESHGGWIATELITLEGDINGLNVWLPE